jgi:hypothetical protein
VKAMIAAHRTQVFNQNFRTRQSNAIGETLTLARAYLPTAYNKPVMIMNGQHHFYYCQGNCFAGGGDVTADALAYFFPHRVVELSKADTLPNTSQDINFHLSRLEAFAKMLDFVESLRIGS